jgi:DUF971 family protein
MESHPKPTDIVLHQKCHTLDIVFDSGESFQLPWEYLRVFSPSIEVRGRRGSGRLLVKDKHDVVLNRIEPIGNYAVKLFFDDGHNSGLYDWRFLYELGKNHTEYWEDHLRRLATEHG